MKKTFILFALFTTSLFAGSEAPYPLGLDPLPGTGLEPDYWPYTKEPECYMMCPLPCDREPDGQEVPAPPPRVYASSSITLANASFEVGYAFGRYISLDENYLELGLFAPVIASDNNQFFLDAKGYRFDSGKWGSSTGLGWRTRFCGSYAFGVNAYYDYLRSPKSNNYNQLGVGVELLAGCFDVRANGYFPFGTRKYSDCLCFFDDLDFGGDFFATNSLKEFSYTGFDAEVGINLFSFCDINFYAAGGPYYYKRSDKNFDFWGGYGRFEISWKDILSAQVIVTGDEVYNTNVQGIVRLSIPFSFFNCSTQCTCDELLLQRVRRNGVILTDTCCDWTWNWDDTIR